MTNAELRTLRKSLGLTTAYCADRIGKCSVRTWKYWESGRDGKVVRVPDDVQTTMLSLKSAYSIVLPNADFKNSCVK